SPAREDVCRLFGAVADGFWASLAWRARRRPSSLSRAFRRAGIPGFLPTASLEWAGEALFGEDGGSWSQTNSLIPIARSARRSYRGKAGSAVARSTITGLATVWSAPRQVMTHQPA